MSSTAASFSVDLTTHLEPVGPSYDDGSGMQRYAVVTLSVAIDYAGADPAIDEVRRLMFVPGWLVTHVRLAYEEMGTWHFLANPVKVERPAGNPDTLAEVKKRLQQRCDGIADVDAFRWKPPASGLPERITDIKRPSSAEKDKNPWRGYLAEIIRLPAPLPMLMNVCAVIKVPALPAADRVCVAPIITLPDKNVYEPGTAPGSLSPVGDLQRWKYQQAGSNFEVRAYTLPSSLVPPPAPPSPPLGAMINTNTLWVENLGVRSIDRMTGVEGRFAEALDPPTLLIGAARRAIADLEAHPKPIGAPQFDMLRRMLLSSLRDGANSGFRAGPSGDSAVAQVFGADAGNVLHVLQQKEGVLTRENWKNQLAAVMREARGGNVPFSTLLDGLGVTESFEKERVGKVEDGAVFASSGIRITRDIQPDTNCEIVPPIAAPPDRPLALRIRLDAVGESFTLELGKPAAPAAAAEVRAAMVTIADEGSGYGLPIGMVQVDLLSGGHAVESFAGQSLVDCVSAPTAASAAKGVGVFLFKPSDPNRRFDAVRFVMKSAPPGGPPPPAFRIGSIAYLQADPTIDDLKALVDQGELARVVLSDEEQLRRAVRAEWAAAAVVLTTEQQSVLDQLAVRRLTLLGHAGGAWRLLKGSYANAEALRNEVVNAALRYLHDRLGAPIAATPYDGFRPDVGLGPPVDQIITDNQFMSAARTHIEACIPDWDRDDIESARDHDEDLVIPLGDVRWTDQSGSNPHIADKDDVLRRISGLGILVRRDTKPASEWKWLNLGRLREEGKPGLVSPVPLRLAYQGGRRDSELVYREEPMCGESPAARLTTYQLQQRGPAQPEDVDSLADIEHAYQPGALDDKDYPRLEPLVYTTVDQQYEATVPVVGHAGILPPPLADPARPWSRNDKLGNGPLPNSRRFSFQRRVPVGRPRLDTGEEKEHLHEMRAIPRDVTPAAWSVLENSLTALGKSPSLEAAKRDDYALVLLTPSGRDDIWQPWQQDFRFRLRPPSVPLRVWNRWVAGPWGRPEVGLKDRVEVYREVWGRLDKAHPARKAAPPEDDPTLDDPAVVTLGIKMRRLFSVSGAGPLELSKSNYTFFHSKLEKLAHLQRRSTTFICRIGPAMTQLPAESGEKALELTIPAGEVWELECTPTLAGGAGDRLVVKELQPVRWLLEGAVHWDESQFARLSAEAFKFLSVASDPPQDSVDPAEGDTKKVMFTFDVPEPLPDSDGAASDEAKLLRYLSHRVEFDVQRWRWDGRPHVTAAGLKGADGVSKDINIAELSTSIRLGREVAAPFDPILFADRDDRDALVLPARLDLVLGWAGKGGKTPVPAVQSIDVRPTAGVLYFRAAARAFSRYEGLLRARSWCDSRDSSDAVLWLRHLVPCRFRKEVPRPKVRGIIPLTRPLGLDGQPSTPGLLVVIDEPWYRDELGGLGERLEAGIVDAALPDSPGEVLPEFGPDPILRMSAAPFDGRSIGPLSPVGPVGHTFDTDSSAPLYSMTSFVIQPPTVAADPDAEEVSDFGDDLAWSFLKIRFRRKLTGIYQQQTKQFLELSSAWTEGIWAQLLPSSNHFLTQRVDAADQPLVSTAIENLSIDLGASISVRDATMNEVRLVPTQVGKGARAGFELYLVLTEQVYDAFGRANQERYVSCVSLASTEELELKTARPILARIVEVQALKSKPAGAESLWSRLFPEGTVDDPDPAIGKNATARIVRVSSPIPCRIVG